MANVIVQLQLLLGALSALLPLLPESARARVGDVLKVVGDALGVGALLSTNAETLAQRLTDVRAEIEMLAATQHAISADDLDAALTRVTAASVAFRAALQTAEAGAS